jgi:hypothetical protein
MTRRHGFALAMGLVVLCLTCSSALAQTPQAVPADAGWPAERPSFPEEGSRLLFNPAQPVQERWGGPWGVDAVLGLPTGLRVEKFFSAEVDRSLVLEGFAGLYVILPAVGGGVRWHGWCLGSGQDTLLVSPGIDAYFLFNPFSLSGGDFEADRSTAGLVSVDVDCAWRHAFDSHWSGELGLKVGGGIAFSKGSLPLPLLGLYGGFRF